jgi:cytoskeletal protein CcmA (bactofilin family)
LINAAFITIAFSVSNALAQSQQWWRTNGNTPNSTDFLGTSNPSPLIIKTNNVERLRIDANGKIGIGITNPQYLLDVNGQSKFRFAAYFDSLLQCSSLKVSQLSGNGTALLSTDAQGNILRFNFSGNNQDVLTGNGNWTSISNLLPSSFWQSSGQNIFYNYGYVGIGTSNPLFALDVFGDVRVSNNIYVGGGIVISDKVNAITEVNTSRVLATEAQVKQIKADSIITTDKVSVTTEVNAPKVSASEATISRIQADSIMMDSTKAIYGNTVVKGDVRLENKLTIQGNAKFNGLLTATQGLLFDNTNGMKYISGSGTTPDYIIVGKVGNPPPPINPCFNPAVLPSPVFHPGGWMQLYYNNTSLELITDGANSLIESSGNGGLLINYYCGKDIAVGSPTAGGNLITNNDVYVYGKLGVGTNTPTEKVDVSGTIRAKAGKFGWNNEYIELSYDGSNHRMETSQSLLINYTSGKDVVVGNASGGNLYVNGKIGIGVGTGFTCYDPNVRLAVNGHIKAKEVVVEMTGWCDDRLDKNFKRMSWIEKEKYISEHQHLPEIPAEKEVKEKGMYTSQVIKGILANTEDNTMDIIELYKEIEKLKQEVDYLRKALKEYQQNK